MRVWIVSREYAGIAEAGGVKNVCCSLSENLALQGHDVTVFMPLYGCTNTKTLDSFYENPENSFILSCGKKIPISFAEGKKGSVKFVFIKSPCYSEKNSLYTYTAEDEKKNPLHKAGRGFEDYLLMDTVFQKAAVLFAKFTSQSPDIVHCHDAPAALVPVFAHELSPEYGIPDSFYSDTRFAVTIHNAGPGYRHEFSGIKEAAAYTGLKKEILEKGLAGGVVEPFLLASFYSSLTTVSPEYAEEILSCKTETGGLGKALSKLKVNITGICNGIDFFRYDPSNKNISLLPFEFDPLKKDLEGKKKCRDFFLKNHAAADAKEKNASLFLEQNGFIDDCDEETVFIAYHGRIVHQKGIDVLEKTARMMLCEKQNVRFFFAGQGFSDLEKLLEKLCSDFPGKAVYLKGYNKKISRLCVAAADFSVHPSWFEPCGLEDFIAQIFATMPVANATGGLCKISDGDTGFIYSPNRPETLYDELSDLVKIHSRIGKEIFMPVIKDAAENVKLNFSWENVVKSRYIPFYEDLMKKTPDRY